MAICAHVARAKTKAATPCGGLPGWGLPVGSTGAWRRGIPSARSVILGFLDTSAWSWCLAILAGFVFAMLVPLSEWLSR